MKAKNLFCVISALCCTGFCGCGKPIQQPGEDEFSVALQEITTDDTSSDAGAEVENITLIPGVPHYSQSESYLTACETLAAVSLLQFYGIEISPDVFIERYLPVTDYPHWEASDNQLHGESPWEYFIGDPMAQDAYGCYNTVIAQALNTMADGLALKLNNVPLDVLCHTYIDNGQPLIIWATMNMAESFEGNSWQLPNGEQYTFTCPEHALLLIGYDDDNYYFSDSLQKDDVTAYSKESVETAYTAMYQMAIGINATPDMLKNAAESIGMQPESPVTEDSAGKGYEIPAEQEPAA